MINCQVIFLQRICILSLFLNLFTREKCTQKCTKARRYVFFFFFDVNGQVFPAEFSEYEETGGKSHNVYSLPHDDTILHYAPESVLTLMGRTRIESPWRIGMRIDEGNREACWNRFE